MSNTSYTEKELDDFTNEFLAEEATEIAGKETNNLDLDLKGGEPTVESDGSNVWEGATDSQREEVKSLQNRLALSEHAASSDRGRNKALHAKVKKMEEEKLAQAAAPIQQSTADESKYTDQELADMREDLPEVDALVSQGQADLKKSIAQIESRLNDKQDASQIVETVNDSGISPEQEAAARREIEQVEAVHPKFKETVNSIDYTTWLSRQPSGVRDMARSPQADNAIAVISMFKGARNINNDNELDAFVDLPSKGLTKSGLVEADDFDAQFEHFSKQFDT